MSRIYRVTALAAVLSITCCAPALASFSHVSGGTTQITLTSAAASKLAANHLSLTPLAPGTVSGSTFSFSISRGFLDTKTLRGKLHQAGGLQIFNGTRTVRMRRLELVSNRRGASLSALFRTRTRRVCARPPSRHHPCAHVSRFVRKRIARLTGVVISSGTASGKLRLTKFAAGVVNRLAGKRITRQGALIATITVTPQFG